MQNRPRSVGSRGETLPQPVSTGFAWASPRFQSGAGKRAHNCPNKSLTSIKPDLRLSFALADAGMRCGEGRIVAMAKVVPPHLMPLRYPILP